MSGATDTSNPAARMAFCTLVTGGGGARLRSAASWVQHCTLPLPLETAALLDLPPGATYAQGAARLRQRHAAGTPGI